MTKTKKQTKRNTPPLQDQLVLASWFARKLGYYEPEDMLASAKSCGDTAEHSPGAIVHLIKSREDRLIPDAELDDMDDAIRGDLTKINRRRSPPVKLKYFQYLAALSAEYFLRRRAESADALANDINQFAKEENLGKAEKPFATIQPSQLSKLAFWMATGSGKTLLMHLNYWQCLRLLPFAPNNILLITPNEDMTKQHIAELRDSDIPCYRHGESGGGVLSSRDNAVCVLDIHKLQENPGKKSDTVKPEFFEKPNLVFVDEGHKGGNDKKEKGNFSMRKQLAEEGGFTMEYSATFGQAFVNLPERTKEYGRAIAFDYSYRYFYDDGYGKDFFILNTDGKTEYNEDLMLLGNLFSFCQQRLAYDNHPQMMEKHNIAAPLLLMLGAHVVGGNKPNNLQQQTQTDIVRIVDFLRRVCADDKWLRQQAERVIKGDTGMKEDGKDIFHNKFAFLRRCVNDNIGELCAIVRQKVFHTDAPGALRFTMLTKTGKKDKNKYEIALRINDNKPFALVYVGDARKLREITERDAKEVQTDEDMLQESLFDSINQESSPVNILIGAKKFMEGWSSWRVCGIGLLNVGIGEGPLIIQLFGRGVRLRGFGFSLKRSTADAHTDKTEADKCLRLLEMLNIFAVRASFMKNFRDYLQREGVMHEIITVPVKIPNPPPNLPIPQIPPREDFDEWSMFTGDEVQLDLSSVITIGQQGDVQQTAAKAATKDCEFVDAVCRRIDFCALHTRLLEEQNNGGIGNIIFAAPAQLKEVLSGKCKVLTDINKPLNKFKHNRLQQTAFAALRQSAKKQHSRNLRQWQQAGMKSGILNKAHNNFGKAKEYKLRIKSGKKELKELAKTIREIIDDKGRLYSDAPNCKLPRLYYERHLYNPLLLDDKHFDLSPPGLNGGERDFVDALRDYVNAKLPADTEICLLRNLPNNVGIGFVSDDGEMVYPDFILWIRRGDNARVVFVEPHGMRHADTYEHDHRAHLWEDLEELSRKFEFELDSYVISVTKYKDLPKGYKGDRTREDFADKHILFMECLQSKEHKADAFGKLLNFRRNQTSAKA